MSISKMNLMSFKSDRKKKIQTPHEDTYNPLTVKDFPSAKTSSAWRAEAGERRERARLGTAKKI